MDDPIFRLKDANLQDSLYKIRELTGSLELSENLRKVIPGFRTQKGIYKPQNSEFPLWIRQTKSGPYPDGDVQVLPDGSWLYDYTPEAKKDGFTDLSLSTNRSLFKAMQHKVLLGVFIQAGVGSKKTTYEVMGLAYVENFDGHYFKIRGEPIDYEAEPIDPEKIPPFAPFESDAPKKRTVEQSIRESGFQTAVRRAYRGKCSLCELGYVYKGKLISVDAAHIIPVDDCGTSKDVRNGVLLCKNHHDLYDSYLWTFDEDYRVMVSSDRLFRKSAESNHVLKVEGKRLPNIPPIEYDRPAEEAIRFRLDRFISM